MMDPVNANEIYQSLLKNEDAFMQLQKLVLQAEEFHAKNSDYDIIKEYMQLSGNCQELIPYIKELSTCDSHYAMSLLNAVCHIFIRLASDLHMFIAAGTSIVNDILSYGMKTIYNFLKMKQKASRTKSALHLLTSMIALGNPIALQVVSKLNFSNPEFSRLLNRTNFSEDEDVRTAFLNLIVLIITVSNNNTIRQIVEVKGFLNSILPGLISDRVSTIILVLNAFRQHIIENSNIPKTTKLRLFNDYTLKSVIQLYSWKGPIRTKKHGKRKLGEDQYTVAYEVSEEEIAEVRSCAHEFMLALCCSTKNGIIFADLSCGTSAKNYNNVITNILKSIPKPYSEPLMSELVVSILKACPDQIQLYLPIFKDNFVPRISMSWLKAVDFLKQVIKSQNSVSVLFKMQIKRPVMTLVSIAKSFCFLDLLRISDFSEIFMNGHRILCIYLCNFLLCILSQVKTILDFCNHPDVIDMPYDSFEISNFKLTFLSLVFPCLPDVNKLQRYWEKITSEPIEASEDVALKDILLPTFAEELLTLIDVLKIYKTLANELHKEFDLDLLQMLNDLKICNIHVPWSDLSKIYITLMDLLSEQYSVSLWKKHQPSESPLMLVLDVYLAAHKSKETFMARDIVYKILIQTQIFDHCEWEIDIWLDSIEYVKSRHIPFVFELISEAIRVLLMQSNSIADVKNMSKVKNENVESNETDENEIICLQPDEKQKFSNFTAAVFDCLLSLEENKKKSVQIFVQKSIRHLMHHQYSARSFLAAVENYRTLIDPDLFAYWQFLTLSPDIKICIENTCTGNSLCSLDFSEHLGQNFISSHSKVVKSISCNINELFDNLDGKSIRKALWQVLMYIDFEIKTTLKDGTDDAIISTYIKLLDKLLSSLPILATKDVMDIDCNDEVIKVENDSISPAMPVVEIVKDFLNHPIVLKLFLFYTKNSEKGSNCLSIAVVTVTKLVLDVVQKVLSSANEKLYPSFSPFKKKVFKYLQKHRKHDNEDSIQLISIIGTFSPLFSINDVQILLENLLNVKNDSISDLDSYFTTLCLLLQTFLERKELILLSSNCINSLIVAFVSMSKKKKKLFRQYILQLLQKHPIYALLVTEDSSLLLLQAKCVKDLPILGEMIDHNDKFRQVAQAFISDKLHESDSIEFLYIVSKCLCNSSKENEEDNCFKDVISSNFLASFEKLVLQEISADMDILPECAVGKALQLLLKEKFSNPKKLLHFCKHILKESDNIIPSPEKMLVVLQVFESWKFYSLETNKVRFQILKICCLWLSSGLSNTHKIFELTSFIKEILMSMNDSEIESVVDIFGQDFFSNALKFALKSEDNGKDILEVLCLLSEKSKGENLPVLSIYGLLTGHSRFFELMLSEEKEKSGLKECLIDLLIILTKLDSSVCKENHVGLILSAYSASMTTVDQKLLYLLKVYADNNIDMSQYSPFLWGKVAISHYSIMKMSQNYLWKQPKLQDILSLYLPEKIENTLLNWPLDMKLEPISELVKVDDHLAHKMYDLRFCLPLFSYLLSPGAFVHCTQFIQSKVLMLIFISLSSLEAPVRALGYYCLTQFYQHLEGSNFREKGIWLCLLDSLCNSIVSTNPKIPNIITLFLARAVDIFTKPEHKLYRPLYAFILRKPCLDIAQVPEFYNLFNSTYIEHRIHRQWLLNLLADGLRSSLDFHICEKRYIFSTLLLHYTSCLSTSQERVSILQTVNSAVKIESSARTLCQKALLTWLHNSIEECDWSHTEILKHICEIMKNLEVNVPDNFHFTVILWSLIAKIKFLDIGSIKTLLSALLKSLTTMKNSDNSLWSNIKLSEENVEDLYKLWKSLVEKLESKQEMNTEEGKDLTEVLNIKETFLILAKIIIFWEPLLGENVPESIYNKQIKYFNNILELILKNNENSLFYSKELPLWLYKCMGIDSRNGLIKMFLSSEGEKNLTSIIRLFEKDFSVKEEFKDNCLNWKKILLYMNDTLMNSNITSCSMMFQQICDAVR